MVLQVLAAALSILVFGNSAQPQEGAASVPAVLKQMQAALTEGKPADLLAVIHPDDRLTFAQVMAGALALSGLAHLDDTKAADKAMKDAEALLAKHHITAPLTSPATEIFRNTDVPAFVGDAIAFLKTQMPKGQSLGDALSIPAGAPADVAITGGSATAKIGADDLHFTRVNGRWFFRVQAK